MKYVCKASCAVLVAALTLAMPALARGQSQATTGEINGRVVDAQAAILPGVTVTARNTQTGLVRSVVTNEEGVFSLPLLPPGTYDIDAELQGFGAFKQIVPVTVGATITLKPTLQVAGVAEQVVVTGVAPIVET